MKITINQASQFVGKEVTIGAWLANKRSSGKIAFLQLRDGTGFMQGVVVKAEVGDDIFATAKALTQEQVCMSQVQLTKILVPHLAMKWLYLVWK